MDTMGTRAGLLACVVAWTGIVASHPGPALARSSAEATCPPCGTPHVELRVLFIHTQALQARQDYALVTGDSITEGLWLDRLAGLPVVNGGIGGGGVSAVATLFGTWPAGAAKPRSIVIAIGVNDAVKGPRDAAYFANWEATYRQAIAAASRLAPGRVALSTIIPVEAGKALGESYFDREAIARLNDAIRRVARETGCALVDNDPAFLRLREARRPYTLDGVHLNALGFDTWKANLQAAAPK